jgi:hypothetical protein
MPSPKLKLLTQGANYVPTVSLPVATAIKALRMGEATSHQQQTALEWIIRDAAGKATFAFHQTDRDTAFALGRQFVADQIIGLFNADLYSLRNKDVPDQADLHG